MNLTSAQAQKLLSGSHTFTQLGFSMLITRLKGIYAKDSSPTSLQKCTGEINEFIKKYSVIMSADFTVISKL